MEARVGTEGHGFYGMGMAGMDLQAMGKRSYEWDLNNWNWDGDLFIAKPLNSQPPSSSVSRQMVPTPAVVPAVIHNSLNCSSSCSDELESEKGRRELEKRRRAIVVDDEFAYNEEVGGLSLKLGGNGSVSEREVGNCGKKTKLAGGSRAVCQVEDCGADLSNAKDYHRRHKVCEKHSKASTALVGNQLQRFCQQCSRFHLLQEFDEGKRSCRRRLAGHNRRRRKANPDAATSGSTSNHDQTSSYLLITLLKILSNMHSIRSDQTTDQDVLSHILRSLAGLSSEQTGKNILGVLQDPRNLLTDGASHGNSEIVIANGEGYSRPFKEHLAIPVSGTEHQAVHVRNPNSANAQAPLKLEATVPKSYAAYAEVREDAAGRVKVNNFDLNDIYIDSDTDDVEISPVHANTGTSSIDCPLWARQDSHQSSPPQTSQNSDSMSARSPSSSSGDAQSRTDRIVFKLFGKEPNDFPLVLRAQILNWLAHSPTDIESYIRPGCVILTIYLRQAESAWDELCYDLSYSLSRLLDVSDDTFWRTGWVYVRVQNQIAFIYNGQVLVDTLLPPSLNNISKVVTVKPIAISASKTAQFTIKGVNLSRPTTRLLCAINGGYVVLEHTKEVIDDADKEHTDCQCLSFSCSIPTLTGRGFIEIEDQGFNSSFFPFIVADEDVCSEIRMLEDALEFTDTDAGSKITGKMEARSLAMDFIHEMGWLLHHCQSRLRLGHLDLNTELFPLGRFKWLMEFSMDREWCAVVKKLLNVLFNGIVGTVDQSSVDLALSEMGLLHRAVRRNSRPLVEVLLRYVPDKLGSVTSGSHKSHIFRPDTTGPAGLTPLHIAAGKDASEDVLDALTDDPGMVGIKAWKNARDSTGSTPEDYARLRGHYIYIHLVQKKINRSASGHMVVDIPGTLSDDNTSQKPNGGSTSSFEILPATSKPTQSNCKLCHLKLAYGVGSRSRLYRPAMLSMLAIAAVCVCVALLFKSSPEVVYVFRPFRWEFLDYGTS